MGIEPASERWEVRRIRFVHAAGPGIELAALNQCDLQASAQILLRRVSENQGIVHGMAREGGNGDQLADRFDSRAVVPEHVKQGRRCAAAFPARRSLRRCSSWIEI
jgi:hypothetical protein